MFAMLVAKLGEPTILFPEMTFLKRGRSVPQFGWRGPRMDEAMKAGIGAAVCSVIILAIMFTVLQALPLRIG
jgi:hypothetical protein